MTRWQFSRFVVATTLFAGLTHLAAAVLVASSLSWLYPERIYDVRQWPVDAGSGLGLVGSFLRASVTADRPVLVFAGSSVTYGYLWPERVTFAHLVAAAHPEMRILNSSIIGADVSGVNDWVICAAKRNRLHLETVVVELPVVNTLTYLVNMHEAKHPIAPLSRCDDGPSDPGYLRYTLSAFRGIGWINLWWSGYTIDKGERVFETAAVPERYFASAAEFEAVRGVFKSQIIATLENAQSIATEVYAFPSPVFVTGVTEANRDGAAVRAQLQVALDACRSVAGARCIDPAALYEQRGHFANLTHLNKAGHIAMAELIKSAIAH